MKPLYFLLSLLVLVHAATAQWSTDPTQNLKVAGGGINPEICIDGSGGCFIVWETGTVGNRRLLRMQHLNRYGYKSFPETGISLASGEFDQSTPFFLTYGGEGTAIVLFYDTRFIANKFVARTLAQRVDTTGTLLWGSTATRPTQSDSSQTPTALLADGEGGAFVFWAEDRNGDGVQEMFGNRITADGQLLWGQDGRKFADYAYDYLRTQVATDSAGGLFIAYTQISGIVIHHIDGTGQFVWSAPIPMSIGIWGALASDNSGGFFWTAHEQIAYRPPVGAVYRTRAFRFNSAGSSLWPTEGIAITDSAWGSGSPEVIVNDKADVAIIYHALAGTLYNIYAERLTFDGELLFEYGGRSISTYPSSKAIKRTCLGTDGNVLVIWKDGRMPKRNLFAQSLLRNGSRNWDEDVAISLHPDTEWDHRVSSDGNGGCIVTWYEIGTGSGWGIFAQQVSRNGNLGEVLKTSVSLKHSDKKNTNIPLTFTVFPNPFKDTVRFHISVSQNLPIAIKIFDLKGRTVRTFQSHLSKDGGLTVYWDGRDHEGKSMSSGIYLVEVQAGKFVASQKVILIR